MSALFSEAGDNNTNSSNKKSTRQLLQPLLIKKGTNENNKNFANNMNATGYNSSASNPNSH
jgi:hypothetical protein